MDLFPFDPTYGHTIKTLLGIGAPPEPADYEEFWRRTYSQARGIALNISRRPITSLRPHLSAFEIEFDSWEGMRIGGWLTAPNEGEIRRGVVVGHGYGGRDGPDWDLPGEAAVAIFPCARGLGRSRRGDLPEDAQQHVLVGLESRDRYILRGCCCDYWAGASALLELFPQVRGRLDYMGTSFGGGVGAMMLPWDERFARAFLDVPSFGNHPLRVTMECTGSGQAVRQQYLRDPRFLNVLAYYDAAVAARHIRIPTFVAAATYDPSVPPPGQFAVYNALEGPKELFIRQAAHMEWDGRAQEDRRLFERLETWFGA